MEIYENDINFTGGQKITQIRSGTVVYWNNRFTGNPNPVGQELTANRQTFPFPTYGGANGYNPWDVNDPHGLYLSGTHQGTNSSKVVKVTGAGWAVDQWKGFEITRVSSSNNVYVLSNTSDTITTGNPFTSFVWNTGDAFVIYKVITSLDQPGWGNGDLVIGNPPLNNTTGTETWIHEQLEPAYSWGNTLNGSPWNNFLWSDFPTVQLNREFYNNTVKPGYVPYPYPHPLVSGTPDTNATLFVSSENPSSTVPIIVSPADNNGNSDGNTPFNRPYLTNIVVSLTAPSAINANNFQKWKQDGTDISTSLTTTVQMDAGHTMTCVYIGTGSPPVAAFHGSPFTGTSPLFVHLFDDTGNATSWSWVLGDGETNTLQNLSHTYTTGSYTVSLTAANATGTNTITKTNYIVATNPPVGTGKILKRKSLDLSIP
jgi:hypothetical protein